MEIVIASGNEGKIREYRDILTPLGFTVSSQKEKGFDPDVKETGATFAENALLKARALRRLTGYAVLSDDSGLEVTALGGEPGIRSARYRGLKTEHERRAAILEALRGAQDRSARFVTCICLIDAGGTEHLFEGVWQGHIAEEESGSSGFGYDPIFIPDDGDGRTTASHPISFKEQHSHRARAVRALTAWLAGRRDAKGTDA